MAVLGVGVAMALRLVLERWGRDGGLPVYITFYPVVMVVAILCGLGPGLVATLLCAMVADYWIIEPHGLFAYSKLIDVIGLVLFLAMGAFMSAFAEMYRRSRSKAAAYERALELRETQEQHRLAMEAADMGAWDYRFDLGQVTRDRRCWDMWGLSGVETVDYAAVLERICPEDRARVDAAIQAALAGADNGVYHQEFRITWPNGSVHWIASHGRAYFEGEGENRRPIRFVGANRDITAEKRDAEASARLAAIVESSDDAIVSKDLAGIIRTWNAGAERLFGYRQEEVVGKPIAMLLPPEKQADEDKILAELKAGQRVQHYETVRLAKGGRRIDVSLTVSPLIDAQGRIVGASKIAHDITKRKRTEEALQKTVDELRRSNQELEQFGYITSHDLQEPLRQVRSFTQLLGNRCGDKLDPKAGEYMRFITEGASRMSDLVQDLLTYSRVGMRETKRHDVSCQAALDWALANLKVSIAESGARIRHDELPTVNGDPTQLSLLFQNLVGNAIKFRRHGVPPEIHVGCRSEDGHWLLWVRDNGIGIDPEHHARVFQIFQRLHGRGKYAGTGIGLAICKKVVEWHGGRIWIESKDSQGATFYFTLPKETKT
jgi:PAS domain S-box-containing protein